MRIDNIEVGVVDSICYGIIVLFGERGEDWDYLETDLDWWQLRLWIRRN